MKYIAGQDLSMGKQAYFQKGWCGHGGSTTNWFDIDGDGKADMLCDDSKGNHWAKLSKSNGKFKRDLGRYLGGWCGHGGSKTNWADIDGDGKADILCDDSKGRHWAQLSNGDGKFKKNLGMYLKGWCGHGGSRTQWADIDGDGKADILCDDSKGRHWAQLSRGDGKFKKNLGMYLKGWCGHPGSYTQWADIDGDGKDDIICDDSKGRHWAQLSNGDGKFKKNLGMFLKGWCGHPGSRTQWADINGDEKADIICDDGKGNHWAKLSLGNGKFIDLGLYKKGWCYGKGAITKYADTNGDGTHDIHCDQVGNHWSVPFADKLFYSNPSGKLANAKVGTYDIKKRQEQNHVAATIRVVQDIPLFALR